VASYEQQEHNDAVYERFLEVCWWDDHQHGSISCTRVRAELTNNHGLTIHPQTYSQMWARATAKGGPMITLAESDGFQRLRRWVSHP
jgi:hypothetical protein